MAHNVVGIVLDRAFFLQLAGRSISLEDVRDADPELHRACKEILEMDAGLLNSDILGLTFTRDVEMLGSMQTIKLCPGGEDMVVNSSNRKDFIDLHIQHQFVTSISEQVAHFAQGFADMLIRPEYVSFFFQSLELEDFNRMMGGSTNAINVREWREHTNYTGYKSKDKLIYWFWEVNYI